MWWIALALIIAGILLMFVEFLLVPGVGVAGIFSLISLGAACWYTFDYIGYNAGWWVTSVVLALLLILLFIILRTKTWKKFELDTDVTSQVNTASSQLHEGDRGVTLTRLAPIGTGRFGTVCKLGTGFDDAFLDAMPALLDDTKTDTKPSILDAEMVPDV